MVIDQTDRLHMGVNNGWTNERKPSLLQVPANGFGFFRHSRYLGHGFPLFDDRLIPNEMPQIFIEAPPFILHFQEAPGIIDRGSDL